jgi:hypothetical protein
MKKSFDQILGLYIVANDTLRVYINIKPMDPAEFNSAFGFNWKIKQVFMGDHANVL